MYSRNPPHPRTTDSQRPGRPRLRYASLHTTHPPISLTPGAPPESDLPSPDEWENTSPLASDDEIGLAVSP